MVNYNEYSSELKQNMNILEIQFYKKYFWYVQKLWFSFYRYFCLTYSNYYDYKYKVISNMHFY